MIEGFAALVPCPTCRDDFQRIIRESPPRCEGRANICRWAAEAHNEVNRKLGKPEVSVDEIVRKAGSCASGRCGIQCAVNGEAQKKRTTVSVGVWLTVVLFVIVALLLLTRKG